MKVGIFVTNQNPLGTDMVSALDEQFAMTRLARDRGWEAVGANFLFFRTHWLGMPLAHALASMRLMSDELLPALRQVKG